LQYEDRNIQAAASIDTLRDPSLSKLDDGQGSDRVVPSFNRLDPSILQQKSARAIPDEESKG